MTAIKKLTNVCVSFAVDDNYAPYLSTTIKSMLSNRNCNFGYDILIMCSGIRQESKDKILSAAKNEAGVSIRFIDVTEAAKGLQYNVGTYLTVATNYRLLLFSDLFAEYDRMIYLDSDVIVEGDISELFNYELGDKLIAGVPDAGFIQLSYSKRAVFIDGKYPYNVDNYRTDALKMKHPKDYFNAGVLMVDLKKCREFFAYSDVLNILHSKKFQFNDQDVLNILCDGRVCILDYEWNYQNNIEAYCRIQPDIYCEMYMGIRRSSPKIIHYVSAHKPWNCSVDLGEHYKKFEC